MYLMREYDCEGCGKPTRRRRHNSSPFVCIDCGIANAAEAARQMAEKSGPAYDAWRQTAGPAGRPVQDPPRR